jgi:hypothetical protein
MPKARAIKRNVVTGTVLTKKDAVKFARDAKRYTARVTTSKAKAKKALRSLGINPSTGKLTKRRG